jgi:hypothetical protein
MSDNEKVTSLRKLVDKLNDVGIYRKVNSALERVLDQASEFLKDDESKEEEEPSRVARGSHKDSHELECR